MEEILRYHTKPAGGRRGTHHAVVVPPADARNRDEKALPESQAQAFGVKEP